jgi:hypothetical protein
MEELKTHIEKINKKWKIDLENLTKENKKLNKEIKELKDILLTIEKVCNKIRVEK